MKISKSYLPCVRVMEFGSLISHYLFGGDQVHVSLLSSLSFQPSSSQQLPPTTQDKVPTFYYLIQPQIKTQFNVLFQHAFHFACSTI